jgi:cytochrome P450
MSARKAFGAFRSDPLSLFAEVAAAPDGVAVTGAFGRELTFITHPDHVAWVLRDNHRNYTKDAPVYRAARPFLGSGLTVSPGGDDWLRQRRLVQPAFDRQSLTIATRITEECLGDLADRWAATAARSGTVDASAEMSTLSMRLACRTLFGTELTDETAAVATDLRAVCDFVVQYLARPFPPLFVPTAANRRFHAAMGRVRAAITALVARPNTELIARLVADGETGGSTREQVADELLGLFFAGHETLGHTLAWCWQLLATHPDTAAALRTEIDTVVGGRPPAFADLPALAHTRSVVEETMRLYPVVWIMMRRAVEDDTIGGYRVGAGSWLAWSPYAGNRHPEVWPRPDDFWPGRFTEEHGRGAAHRRHSLAPFGLGPRSCPGSSLAMTQACLTVATLAQRCRMTPVQDGPARPDPSMTLRPAGPLPLRLTPG